MPGLSGVAATPVRAIGFASGAPGGDGRAQERTGARILRSP